MEDLFDKYQYHEAMWEPDTADSVIPGSKIAKYLQTKIKSVIKSYTEKGQIKSTPKLAIVQVGTEEDANVYVRNKKKACEYVGVECEVYNIKNYNVDEDGNITEYISDHDVYDIVIETVKRLNDDDTVHGIIVQMPIPWEKMFKEYHNITDLSQSRNGCETALHKRWYFFNENIMTAISSQKDVDGLSRALTANLAMWADVDYRYDERYKGLNDVEDAEKVCGFYQPATPFGIFYLLHKLYHIETEGKNVVIIGRSDIVGKPMARIMSNKQQGNANVTLLHSKTPVYTLYQQLQNADIVISAVGHKNGYLLTKSNIRPGTIVIDAGIVVEHDEYGKRHIRGDADWKNLKDICKYITPVPGGVGPMTVTMLIYNVYKAWCIKNNILVPTYDFEADMEQCKLESGMIIDSDGPPG